jgi:hypothetical protein
MFEKHREHRAEKHYQEALAAWQTQRDGYADLVATARQFHGVTTSEINLGSGELLFYKVDGAGLVEERRGPGQYQGRSSGVSVPIGNISGHAIRYHVGASRGHYVQGAPILTVIDQGSVFVTNRRVIFTGAKQTRQCDYAKLIGYEHDDHTGTTTFSVSNRQKPTVVTYGPAVAGAFDFRLDLALATYRGTIDQFTDGLQQTLAALDANRPALAQPS